MSQMLGFGVFGLILLGIFVGNKLIPMELAAIFQLTYFMILTVGELNPNFYALSGLKYSSGYNFVLTPLKPTAPQRTITGINFSASILNNSNVSLALILFPIIIGCSLRILAKNLIEN
jgi:hypothetical protein